MLDFPAPEIRVCPPATVFAEKFQTMITLGIANERMKDFYDLWTIPRTCTIEPEASTLQSRRPLLVAAHKFRVPDRPSYRQPWRKITQGNVSGTHMQRASILKAWRSLQLSKRSGIWSDRAASGSNTGIEPAITSTLPSVLAPDSIATCFQNCYQAAIPSL